MKSFSSTCGSKSNSFKINSSGSKAMIPSGRFPSCSALRRVTRSIAASLKVQRSTRHLCSRLKTISRRWNGRSRSAVAMLCSNGPMQTQRSSPIGSRRRLGCAIWSAIRRSAPIPVCALFFRANGTKAVLQKIRLPCQRQSQRCWKSATWAMTLTVIEMPRQACASGVVARLSRKT